MATATNLGFPRIGPRRELKWAVEAYWRGKIDQDELRARAAEIRRASWLLQQRAGIAHVPSNDFSFYDQVLDTTAMVGAVPERYAASAAGGVDLDTYFAMARGRPASAAVPGVSAMEMTKWFDTNYHYIVPEIDAGQRFALRSRKPVEEFTEALRLGVRTRPVLLGPVTYLLLSKSSDPDFDPLSLLGELAEVYAQVLAELAVAGADWVQLDEPALGLTLDDPQRAAFGRAYARLAAAAPGLNLLVAVYFSDLRDNLATALALPVQALHLDLVRGPADLDRALAGLPAGVALSLGLVDGRNIWITDLAAAIATARTATAALGSDRVLIGPSCSLLHAPVDLDGETELDHEIRSWMAFAKQKVEEIAAITRAVNGAEAQVRAHLDRNATAVARRATSARIHNPAVQERSQAVTPAMTERARPFPQRRQAQQQALRLPPYPTTTIGSFPQTAEIRKARTGRNRGVLSQQQYERFLEQEIARTIRFQEQTGLDVLVHGEPERNDMVEYFGEQLDGYVSTANGWVQSYGSRAVKPPVIFGDVRRRGPMTVRWITYAQSLTSRPVKGMLTGPVTMLQWSFVRDDQPRSETCRQLALAIRDEVRDLEQADIRTIQVDEPALREGLPLRREDWGAYLDWAVECFRLATTGVSDRTQIHTHMCYAAFDDIIDSVADMDADVISMENARSDGALLETFRQHPYPNEIGLGVYDIHSPRVAETEEMRALLVRASAVLAPEQLWVNPDCGLKTRRWEEAAPSLRHMIEAARALRAAAAG